MKRTLILFLLALCLPIAVFARKKAKTGTVVPMESTILRTPLDDRQTYLFDSLYFESLSKLLQDDAQEAFRLVSEALEVDSLSAPALYLRSKIYRMQGNPNGLRDVELAVQLDSVNYWYGSALGDLYIERGRYDLAIPCYERLQRQHPEKSDPCYTLAQLYLRADSLDLCLQQLDKIEELDGVNPNLTLQKFYILQQQGKTDEAFNEYDKLIHRFPFDISYRIQLGDLQMKSGMIPQAKVTYDEAAKIDPDNAYLWIAQSNYYSITGNHAAADSLVQQALVNANLDIDTKIQILTEYLKTTLRKVAKEKETAKDTTAIDLPGVDSLFLTVATMHPTAPEVYDLHADYLSAIGRDSSALVQILFAVDLKPSEKKYWGKSLSLAAQTDNFPKVLQLAEAAKRLHPSLSDIYLTTAYVYAKQEKKDSVEMAYKDALQNIEPNEVNLRSRIYGYLGDNYYEMGRKEDAYASYDEALKYNDKNYSVLNNYAYFLCLDGGDLNKAETMAAKVIQQYPDEPTYLDTYAWIYYLQGNYMLAKFYQQRAIDKAGDHPSADLVLHYDAILKALGE